MTQTGERLQSSAASVEAGVQVMVINHQSANIHSVAKALERCGADVLVSGSPADVLSADAVVLPGVGASDPAMRVLARMGLVEPIKEYTASGRPLLAVCLGMQLLFPSSEEGDLPGLGLVDGTVRHFHSTSVKASGAPRKLKAPHMGWNSVHFKSDDGGAHPVFQGIPQDSYFYFVHSYHCVPSEPADVAATTEYGGPVTAAIVKEDLVATQFHPEKSGELGLRIYTNFIRHAARLKGRRQECR